MRKLLLCLTLGLAFLPAVKGQYALEETGIEVGGAYGPLMIGSERTLHVTEAQVNGFWSHYTCGKAYGFHVSGGLYAQQAAYKDGSPPIDISIFDGMNSLGLELGVFGKMRTHTFHRPREFALLAGLKARYRVLDNRSENEKIYANIPRMQVLAHGSIFIRRPLGDDNSLFIRPGVDLWLRDLVETTVVPFQTARPLVFNLAIGVTIWDDRG